MFTPDNRFRRLSKPSPPEREAEYIKKPNMTTSPLFSQRFPSPRHASPVLDPRLQHMSSPYDHEATSQPTSFALQSSDINNIVVQLKSALSDEIQIMIHSLFKTELERAIKESFQGLTNQVETLKQENAQLRDEIDALEQYGRRELMRFSGLPETSGEDTTDIVTKVVKSIDGEFQEGDILRSHRVGNPVRVDKRGQKLPPRQIIVRVKNPQVKHRILKCSKNLKESDDYTAVMINEDLTKRRNFLAYKARKLKTADFITNTWTIDGKIFLKNSKGHITTANTELALQTYVLKNCPEAMEVLYPPESTVLKTTLSDNAESNVISLQQSYAAAAAIPLVK